MGAIDSAAGIVTNASGQPLRATVNTILNNKIVKTTKTSVDGSFTIQLNAGVSSILVYSDNSSTPGFDYLPAVVGVSLGQVVSVSLMPAASLSLKGDILFVDTDTIPSSYSYQVLDSGGLLFSSTGFPLSFSSKSTSTLTIPDLSSTTLIVPAMTPYRLWFNVSILVENRGTTRTVFSDVQQPLAQGTLTDFNIVAPALTYNFGLVETAIAEVSPMIRAMEAQGFYLVRENRLIASAEADYARALQLYDSGSYDMAFYEAKSSYIGARSTLADLNKLVVDAASSVYIIIGFLAIASISAGFLLVDSRGVQAVLGSGLYAGSLIVLSRVYPGTAATPVQGFILTAVVSFMVVIVVALILPKLLGGGSGDGMVKLSEILVPVFSIAKRSLKRRRLRLILTLISLIVLVMSFVSLTSLSEGYGLITTKSGSSSNQGVLLRASTWTAAHPTFIPLPSSEVAWLLKQPEVETVSMKIENAPQQSPITSIARNRIYSIMGVNARNETQILPIASILTSGKLPGSGEVALSVALTSQLGLKLGDSMKLRDQTLTLVGLLDDVSFASLTDLDGSSFIPDKWVNLSLPGDPPYWERQSTLPSEAALLDTSTASLFPILSVTRIDMKVDPAGQDYFAEKLALERGYETWSATPTGVTYKALSNYLEGKGLPLVIPWAIVVLNVVVTMLNSLFERRHEINILSSVGLNPAEIASIFVAEASIMGFIAGSLGYLAGLALYRVMPLLGLALEVQQKVSSVWTLAAIGISISAVLVGAFTALRSSIVITPSLTRKWKLEEGEGGFDKPWVVMVPLKLEAAEVDGFVAYLERRLHALENDQVRLTTRVRVETKGDMKVVSFIYKSYQPTTGNFYTKNSVFVELGEEGYTVRMDSTGWQDWAHETGSLIRRIAMEWSNRLR
jgi:ABC-type lipoprotein release transport system permease subunit